MPIFDIIEVGQNRFTEQSSISHIVWNRGGCIMKATGIVRKTDQLGRIVIPMELRKKLGIGENDPLEIFVDEDMIILKKYQPDLTCLITGTISSDNLSLANGKVVLSRDGAEHLMKELQTFLATS
jgi:AbrB family transcriptional regulator, transcriptional pleiotropic regulator of transition state genes